MDDCIEVDVDDVQVGDVLRVSLDQTNLGFLRARSRNYMRDGAEELTVVDLKQWRRRVAYCTREDVVAKFSDGRCAVLDDFTYNVVQGRLPALPAEIVPDTRLLPEATSIQLSLEDFE